MAKQTSCKKTSKRGQYTEARRVANEQRKEAQNKKREQKLTKLRKERGDPNIRWVPATESLLETVRNHPEATRVNSLGKIMIAIVE